MLPDTVRTDAISRRVPSVTSSCEAVKTPFQLASLRWHMRVAAMAVKARKRSGLRS
jgi:hypothetical protein